jgi:hypothetical protein
VLAVVGRCGVVMCLRNAKTCLLSIMLFAKIEV